MIKHRKISLSFVTILFLLTLTLLTFSVTVNATTYYVATNGSNTAPYDTWAKAATSIQTTVNAASNGDIIIVGSSDGHGTGTYTENVNVNKQLTIQSENGYSTTTIVASTAADHVFDIQANNVTIGGTSVGFSIYGATGGGKAGIYLTSINNCTIENNRCGWDGTHKNYRGIYLVSSDTCTITNNITSYNTGEGIYLSSSNSNNLTSNTVNNNSSDGISLLSSSSDTLISNTANNNTYDGFHVITSSNNTFTTNTASSNGDNGILLATSSNNNTLNSNTTSNNTGDGIALVSSSNTTLNSNTANYDKNGISLSSSSANNLSSNTVEHNEFGIYLTESSNNTITSNTMSNNDGRVDGDGIMLNNNCSSNTITNNTMDNDPGDAIEFYNSSDNNVSGNTISNSGWNIRINYYSSNNTLINNTITGGTKGIVLEETHSKNNIVANNTIGNNVEDGIYLYNYTSNNTITGNTSSNNSNGIQLNSSSNNTIYLNNFSTNTKNVYSNGSTNTWNSPTTIYYDYNSGTYHKGYLGNYYDDGTHTGSYGIGGTYTIVNDNNDDYQLIKTSGNYSLQAWWLCDDNKMYRNDVSKAGGSVTISGSGFNIWTADQAAQTDISFSGSDTWTDKLVFTSAPTNGYTFTVDIGYYDGSFQTGGPTQTITCDGSSTVFTFSTSQSAFTVSTGKYLALKITNNNASGYNIQTGCAWDYTSSPESSTDYALPVELSAFDAFVLENQVILKWQTSTEVDNYGFEIERKIPDQALNDNPGWQKIGFVPGHGNTNTPQDYTFVDKNPVGAATFYYRLKQIDVDGKYEYSDILQVTLDVPNEAELMQNSPNPFNPSTSIKFFIPFQSDVTIKVYDLLGREVTALINKQMNIGFHIVFWNGRNKYGNTVSSGVYLYRLTAGKFTETKKMTLLK